MEDEKNLKVKTLSGLKTLKGRRQISKLLKRIGFYGKIWIIMSKNSFLVMLSQRKLIFLFLLGKLLRFFFFASFLYFLLKSVNTLAGYSLNQTIFFFLTFNIIDIIAQFIFREVYRFRPLVVSGDLDLILAKPISALFRVLMGGSDLIDLLTIPPIIFAAWYVGKLLDPSPIQLLFYILLVINGLLIAAAFHIAVLAFGIITLEVDHTIMIYRDITNLGRFPIDIYKEPLKGILTYLIPVGIMITLPVKAFIGLVTIKGVLLSFLLGFLVLTISLKFWNYALKSYTSASS